MAQAQASSTSSGSSTGGLGRLIGVGLLLAGVVLLALGAYLGPYTYATSTPGKLTVETCTVDYKHRSTSSSSSRKRTKTKWCYGTFTATDGSVKDLNAELRSDSLHQRGEVIDALKTGDTSYQQDTGWDSSIAVGCAWWFGALIPLALGLLCTATGFAFGGASDFNWAKRAVAPGLLSTVYTLLAVGIVGVALSFLVMFIA
ncbi:MULTISPECIES: hypothetical protein [unclassified Streptomyces]|uniref:hypothetical protein n=1 Tax=unclassified Streptomyces TaxID=2593676 RepID=UPI000747EA5B|nr:MULTISPECIES: hypothetical protein [unclassified Streptomyces]KUL72888.1 hypothetical protein ADL34_21555 [Streptomyces sp. NRRL WC-3605]KUL74227.1 hypothetical protein ADL33_18240 [Streptomyces sp. NRRL WC-3604]